MNYVDLKFDKNASIPVYRQIYLNFRETILQKKLIAGDRVPSIRNLASELKLSRGTIELAYQMLIAEGYLIAKGAAGTFIAPISLDYPTLLHTKLIPSTIALLPNDGAPKVFQPGVPALDAFPQKVWTKIAVRKSRETYKVGMPYPNASGYLPLRQSITRYLSISRGIYCEPEQIFITSGYLNTLNLIIQTLFKPHTKGWFEEPGYFKARNFLLHNGIQLIAAPVDAQGIDVESLDTNDPSIHFAIVTPANQSPLGVKLSLSRRIALLEWAKKQQAWIIEDDYDSEFCYQGRPLAPLKSLESNDGQVLYSGTFSKTLYPGLSLAYLVVPKRVCESFEYTAQLMNNGAPLFFQSIIAEFIDKGYFFRHLSKMRALYAIRRQYLINALDDILTDSISIPDQAGGMMLLVYINQLDDSQTLVQEAYQQGLAIGTLNHWYIKRAVSNGILLGFTNLNTSEEASKQVQVLKKIIKRVI